MSKPSDVSGSKRLLCTWFEVTFATFSVSLHAKHGFNVLKTYKVFS